MIMQSTITAPPVRRFRSVLRSAVLRRRRIHGPPSPQETLTWVRRGKIPPNTDGCNRLLFNLSTVLEAQCCKPRQPEAARPEEVAQ